MHAFATNLRFEDDEFNFVKTRAKHGTQRGLPAPRRALRRRRTRLTASDASTHAQVLDAALSDADLAVLLAAVAHLTGDPSLLERYPDAGAFDHGRGPGTLSPDDADAIRARAFDVLTGLDPTPLLDRAPIADEPLHRIIEFCAGEPVGPEYVPLVREEANFDGTDRRRFEWNAPARRRRRSHALPRRDHRRGARRALRGDPARAGRHPVHGVRQERRRRRHVVREHLPRPPRRRAQPLLLVLVPAQPRLVDYYRPTRRARRLHRALREGATASCRTCGSGPRCSRPTSTTAAARWTLQAPRHGDGRAEQSRCNALISAVGMLNRPSVPDIDGLDTFAGPVVPLLALGPRRRPARQAGRGGRHRCQRDAVRACDRARRRAAHDLPAVAPLDHAQPRLPPAGDRRREVAVPARARTTSAGTASSSSGTAPTACIPRSASTPMADTRRLDQPDERQAPPGHDRPPRRELADAPNWSTEVLPDYPPLGKRMLQDNGWFRTLLQATTSSWSTTRSPGSTAHAVVTDLGRRSHPADVIVLATGFQPEQVPLADEDHRPGRPVCTTCGATTPGRTSASRSRRSPTCSASTARTPTRSSGA